LATASVGASAHESTDGAAEHIAEDSVIHTAADEASLERRTAIATKADAASAAAAVAGDEQEVGSWGPVVNWPVVGVHVALMPNGKVLAYDSVGDKATETYPVHDRTRAIVWDPATGVQTPVNVTLGYNVFCSGLAHLPDGSLFLAGGNKNAQLQGIRQTHVFNPTTNTWSLGPDMEFERWYPSVTPLSNGEMLITSGGANTPEVRGTNGALRKLTGAGFGLPNYPWLDVAPNGRTFFSGPSPTMRSLDSSGPGAWQSYGNRDNVDRDYGSRAMYDIGKLLVAGGGPSTKSATVIDVNGTSPDADPTEPMEYGRRQHNLTVLADGGVLATGGLSSGADLVDIQHGVYEAELWNPGTGQWSTLAPMQVTRQYHSTALLLPDGRVLSSGGGICGACDSQGYLAKNAQVFSPPYLFKKDGSGQLAPRPAISSAPSVVNYGGQLRISTPNAASIERMALVRLGAVTHSVDMEQRFIPLAINARDSERLRASAPANANIAPPGPYMLFVIDAAGVPSVARMVTVATGNPPPNQDPDAVLDADTATGVAPLSVSFDAGRSDDPDGDPLSYSWSFGDGATSSAGTATHTYTEPGTYTATLTVSDGLGGTGTASWPVSVREPGPVDPGPGDPGPEAPDPIAPGPPDPLTPGLPDPIDPGAPDSSGPRLRLLGVNAARGRIRGSATDPSGISTVSVAVRSRLGGDECAWWLAAKRHMSVAPRRCDRPRWINARLASTSGEVQWRVVLGKPLPLGSYRVLVKAADKKGNESALPLKRDSLVRVRPSGR
jgi:Domain of unknown function (DUF1929)/PKD domain/Kelch motif